MIIYRRAKYEDAMQLDSLNQKCLPENYWMAFWQDILTDGIRLCDGLYSLGEMSGCVACDLQDNAKIIAYSIIARKKTKQSDRSGIVLSIAVHPHFRRKGIGKRCLEKSIECVFDHTDIRKLYLQVRVGNEVAIDLYHKHHFVDHKLLVDNYDNPREDGIEMILHRKCWAKEFAKTCS